MERKKEQQNPVSLSAQSKDLVQIHTRNTQICNGQPQDPGGIPGHSRGQPLAISAHSCTFSLCLVARCQRIPAAGAFLGFCVSCAFILFHISGALQRAAPSVSQGKPGLEVSSEQSIPHVPEKISKGRGVSRERQRERARAGC